MAARPPHALARTTLATPRRFVLAGATGGLITLASAATALLVLTGTSAVAPTTVAVPPLPAPGPVAGDPGVVVLPTPVGARPGASRVAPAPQHRGGGLLGLLVRSAGPVPPTGPARAAALPVAVPAPASAITAPTTGLTAALRRAGEPASTGSTSTVQRDTRRHAKEVGHGKPAEHATPAEHGKLRKHDSARPADRRERALTRAAHSGRVD